MDAIGVISSLDAGEDGHLFEMVARDPGWLFAWWTTAPCGDRWLSVYRSEYVEDDDRTVCELVAGLELVGTKVEPYSDHMMGAEPRLDLYREA